MNILQKIYRILRSKSIRYILFRSKYEFERRSGLLARRFPINPSSILLPSLDEWRTSNRYLYGKVSEISVQRKPNDELKKCCQRIVDGELQFFSHEWMALGRDYDWVTNPTTNYQYYVNQHWTKVQVYHHGS